MKIKIKDFLLPHPSLEDMEPPDIRDTNTDVMVLVEEITETGQFEEAKYIASFFSYDNIKTLSDRHQTNGKFLSGRYFYARNMLLIQDCSRSTIRQVIEDLIEEGSFKEVFLKLR